MIPVILSGGSGTRLWPISRQGYPKQFCEFFEESLFTQSIKRVLPLGSPWTVTVGDLKILTTRALLELGLPVDQVIYEPSGRNTGPAIAALCRVFELRGLKDEVVGVFSADHLIGNDGVFLAAARAGEAFARQGHIVTLGVTPSFPATGYGYIETDGEVSSGGAKAMRAIGFREKPDEKAAVDFLAHGGYFWNAGMFIFKISRMIEHLRELAPDIWNPMSQLKADLSNLAEIYGEIPKVSIDYAVMEKIGEHVCVPCEFEWTDLGSWDAIAAMNRRSASRHERVVEVESHTNFVVPIQEKSYAFVGVDDLIVVDTQDALLVARRGESENVKTAVDELKTRSIKAATHHQFEIRPWGRFDILRSTKDFKAKIISVDPGAQLSYQSHEKRSEHWIVVKGRGEVVLNDSTLSVEPGVHVFIPVGSKHRIRNLGTVPLQFVEVQLGSYFGEDDIKRFEDDYQRV